MDTSKYRVGNLFISIIEPYEAINVIESIVKQNVGAIVGVSCYGNVLFAKKDSNYAELMNKCYLNVPDGIPLTWFSKLWGIKGVRQTKGPFLFTQMINDKESGIKHFLIGDTDDTLSKIKEKYNNPLIVGMVSPPFCDIKDYDYQYYTKLITDSKANIVWISMTSPKQDFFAQQLQKLLPNVVLIGVGAAFRYSIGVYKETNGIIRKMGLTGLVWRKWSFKLLFKYIAALSNMIFNMLNIIIRRIKGTHYWE